MNKFTLPFIAFLFTLGLFVSFHFRFPFWILFFPASVLGLLGLRLIRSPISSFFLILLVFFLGMLHGGSAASKFSDDERKWSSETIQKGSRPIRVIGIVKTEPALLENGRLSFDLKCLARKEGPEWRTVSGKLRVLSEGHPAPIYGEEVMAEGFFRKPKTPGNPGQFHYANYLRRRGLAGLFLVHPSHGFISLKKKDAAIFARSLISFRRRALERIRTTLPGKEGSLFGAILLGDRTPMNQRLWDLFARTGTVHLLCISGLHVGILAVFFALLWKRLYLPSAASLFLTILSLAGYAAMVGGSPPILRATVMISFYLLGSRLGRNILPLPILSLAYLILVIKNPQVLGEPGFQLSFLSVFFIFVTHQKFKGLWAVKNFSFSKKRISIPNRLGRHGLELFVISSGAWLGIWPVVSHHFYLVSPVSCFLNCLAIPLLFPVVAIGVLWLLAGSILPILSELLLHLEGVLLALLIVATKGFDGIPGGSFRLAIPGIWFIFFYYGMLVLFFSKGKCFRWVAILCVFVVMNGVVWAKFFKQDSAAVVTFLDVGHGDAALLEFPGKRTLLIDAGVRWGNTDIGRQVIAPFLWKHNIRRLDGVLLTHQDRDHAGGIPAMLELVRPAYFFESGFSEDGNAAWDYQELLRKLGVPSKELYRGQRIEGYPGVTLEVLHPPRPFLAGTGKDDNNNGVVLRLTHGTVRILFMADLQEEGIAHLLESGQDLHADILKMPHHGGDMDNVMAPFLEAVSPQVAVISAGEGVFRLPSPRTLALLKQKGLHTYLTSRSGAVRMISDGKQFEISTWRTHERKHFEFDSEKR
ncbi:MAG: DNA internalization-related competence protein ComEC/Rec2 [Candidatus Omnitrophota bacterium]